MFLLLTLRIYLSTQSPLLKHFYSFSQSRHCFSVLHQFIFLNVVYILKTSARKNGFKGIFYKQNGSSDDVNDNDDDDDDDDDDDNNFSSIDVRRDEGHL